MGTTCLAFFPQSVVPHLTKLHHQASHKTPANSHTMKSLLLLVTTPLFVSVNGFAPILSSQVGSHQVSSASSWHHHLSASASDEDLTPDADSISNNHQLQRRRFVTQSIIASGVASFLTTQPVFADEGDTDPLGTSLPKITQKVYLDIKLPTNKTPKRLVIGLFGEAMHKTAENFQTLCTNTEGPSYAGTSFYRVISGTTIQGGAIGSNSSSGKSGTSAFENGAPFTPDNYNIKHTTKGLVSAVRNANGTIDSRFFIQTEDDAGWADDRYAAFGIVLEEEGTGGMELVKKLSRLEVKAPQNSPKDPVLIVGCGLL